MECGKAPKVSLQIEGVEAVPPLVPRPDTGRGHRGVHHRENETDEGSRRSNIKLCAEFVILIVCNLYVATEICKLRVIKDSEVEAEVKKEKFMVTLPYLLNKI